MSAAVLFLIGYVVYGKQPEVGASAASLVSFYDGDRTRILIASLIIGFAILFLLWFAAALASVPPRCRQGRVGERGDCRKRGVRRLLFLHTTIDAALASSIAGIGNIQFTSGLNDLSWVLMVLAWFPAAMLVMAGTFGLGRAGIFSNASFAAGVTAMLALLAGTTTWASDGFWAVDGAYSRFGASIVMLAWVAVVSGFLARRSPSTVSTSDRAVVPAA